MEFKDRLRELRTSKAISAIDLAQMLNKSESAIRMWESGRANPKTKTLWQMADIFNVSVDYMIGRTNIKSPNATIQVLCGYVYKWKT